MKFENGSSVEQIALDINPTNPGPKYRVIERGGRYLIVVHVTGTRVFTVVDDCRTEAFANKRCEALNAGHISAMVPKHPEFDMVEGHRKVMSRVEYNKTYRTTK